MSQLEVEGGEFEISPCRIVWERGVLVCSDGSGDKTFEIKSEFENHIAISSDDFLILMQEIDSLRLRVLTCQGGE